MSSMQRFFKPMFKCWQANSRKSNPFDFCSCVTNVLPLVSRRGSYGVRSRMRPILMWRVARLLISDDGCAACFPTTTTTTPPPPKVVRPFSALLTSAVQKDEKRSRKLELNQDVRESQKVHGRSEFPILAGLTQSDVFLRGLTRFST